MFRMVLMTGLLLSTTPLFAAEVEGIVAFWKLNEGTGNKVKDVSGNGHDGTIKGLKWTAGKFDKGLQWTGKDNADLVQVPDHDDLDGLEAMTCTAWAKIEGTGLSPFPRFVTKGHEDSWTFLFDVNPGNKLRFIVNRPGGKFDFTDPVKLDPFFNKFHHYAATWDGKDVIFYIDGKETSKHDGGKGPGIKTDLPVLLGNSPSGRTFQGVLDEVGVFDRALSQKEIEGLMEGFEKFSAVYPGGKLPTTWGNIKASHL